MNFLSYFMAIFAVIGAIDYMIGCRFGIGKEFEKGFMLFGVMALSMIGMLVLAPAIGEVLKPISNWIYGVFKIDPSALPAMLLANDMGAASLSESIGVNEKVAFFNGLVVSSMMGCTVSFTIPVALGMVKEEHHKSVLSGFLCGIITIPVGCIISGLIMRLPFVSLLLNLLPMILFSVLLSFGIVYFPKVCVKAFGILGIVLRVVITVGLALGIIRFLTGYEIIKGLDTLENGGLICLNASVVMAGAFPFLYIVSKIIARPLVLLGQKLGINRASTLGLFSTLATSVTTFKAMEDMDDKGVVLNSAFAVSAAFTFAGHLAFTISFAKEYVFYVIIGKLISGVCAIVLSCLLYKRLSSKTA